MQTLFFHMFHGVVKHMKMSAVDVSSFAKVEFSPAKPSPAQAHGPSEAGLGWAKYVIKMLFDFLTFLTTTHGCILFLFSS